MGWRRAPKLCPTQWWRSPLPRADRPLKAQLLQRPCPPNNARNLSSGGQRGKPLRWSVRMKKKTMRQLKMASSPKEKGWRLLHHLLHLLLQHQHRLLHQLQLQHRLLPQLPHRQSKQFPWRLHFPWLRLLSPTSWRTPPERLHAIRICGRRSPFNSLNCRSCTRRGRRCSQLTHYHHRVPLVATTPRSSNSPTNSRRWWRESATGSPSASASKPFPCSQRDVGTLLSKAQDDGRGSPLHHI